MVVTKFSVLVARVGWFFVGPIALLLTLWAILDAGRPGFSGHDVLFFCLVVLSVGCRWGEQRSGQATTAEGTPATWEHFRSYAISFPTMAVTAWLVTKLVLILG